MRRSLPSDGDEHYRKVASFLATAIRGKQQPVFLFASATPGEGTTTVTLNVAHRLLADYGLHPLVVELNTLRPVFTRRYNLAPDAAPPSADNSPQTMRASVRRAPDGLALIPAESIVVGRPDVASILRRILAEASPEFDCVLVDAPPILEQADAVAATTVVPRVVLVVEAGRTRVETLQRVRRELAVEGAAIVATVLNRHDPFLPAWLQRWFAS